MLPPSAQKLSSLPQLGSEFSLFCVPGVTTVFLCTWSCFVGLVHHIVLSFPCLSSDRCLFAWSCMLAIPWKVPLVFSCSSGVGLVWKPIPLPPFYFVLNAFWSTSFIFLIKTDHQVILVERVWVFIQESISGSCSVWSLFSLSVSGLVSLFFRLASLHFKKLFFFFFL